MQAKGVPVLYEDSLLIEEVENRLIRASGCKRYNSRKEKRWIEENLADLPGEFDKYGNFHVWIRDEIINPGICYCVNINNKEEKSYIIKRSGDHWVAEPNVWDAEKDGGFAILRVMIEKNVPGYYIFLRNDGEWWLSQEQPELLAEKDIYICFNFCSVGSFYPYRKCIFIEPEQAEYFPIYRLNKRLQKCLGNREEYWEAKKQVDTMKYMNNMAIQIAINPGVEEYTIKTEKIKGINIKEFRETALMFIKNEIFINY